MRVLFAHKTFPGQFAHVAKTLAADPKNEIVFLHLEGKDDLPGVRRLRIRPTRTASATTHYYLQSLETAVLLGQAAYRSAVKLAKGGFRPDVVYAHAGFGPGLYLKDAFPGVPVIGYFEWFYHARGGDADFLNPGDVTEDDVLRIHTRNAGLLLELWRCNRGVAPTVFQRDRFPREFREKLTVLHDGVDTDLFRPANRPTGPTLYELPDDAEIVTYATRGLEPYRGFPHFMEALARLQPTRPRLYALVVGADRVYYSKSSPDGRSCKEIVLERLPELDRSRVRFLPFLPLADYLRVLQASSVHVYLTVPFVLSWSLLEAMATGCPIVASDTPPVREVIRNGETGLVIDFRSPKDLARTIARALDDRAEAERLGAAARREIVQRYTLRELLPRQIRLIQEVAGRIV